MTTISTEVVADKVKRSEGGRRITPRERIEECVRAFETSGLSMMAFARREGLNYPTFVTWVKKCAKGSEVSAVPRFAQVRFSAEGVSAQGLSVTLPDGVVLRGSDPEALGALVRAVVSGK